MAELIAVADSRPQRQRVGAYLLLLPATAFTLIFLVAPALILLGYSVMTQNSDGSLTGPVNLHSFARLFLESAYQKVIVLTLRVSVLTTIITVMLAYPVAMLIAFGHAIYSRIAMVLVVLPMVVSVIVRTYGWQILLGNSNSGALNWLLSFFAPGKPLLQLLYTPSAVIIASVHVFLPLMVLPIASSLTKIDPTLVPAARMLGATPFKAFVRITVPLSVPGLVAGMSLVFALTSASYITPSMIGGSKGAMLGNLLEQQMTTVYDWAMGGAIAVTMVFIAVFANTALSRVTARRRS